VSPPFLLSPTMLALLGIRLLVMQVTLCTPPWLETSSVSPFRSTSFFSMRIQTTGFCLSVLFHGRRRVAWSSARLFFPTTGIAFFFSCFSHLASSFLVLPSSHDDYRPPADAHCLFPRPSPKTSVPKLSVHLLFARHPIEISFHSVNNPPSCVFYWSSACLPISCLSKPLVLRVIVWFFSFPRLG